MQEFQLIKKYFSSIARDLSDDAATLSVKPDEQLVISKDLMVEDRHFLLKDGGYKIAKKLLYSNLSDLAASGAKPVCYMLGFSKNNILEEKFYEDFSRGLKEAQKEFKLDLLGGDTVHSDKLVFSITIFGVTKKNKILARSQGKAGDLVFVSGFIGDAFLRLERHFFPTPRIKLGQYLLKKNLSKCAIDVSDGLLADLRHICEESKLQADIELEKIPLSKAAKKMDFNIMDLLSGGDDYELVFTGSKKNYEKIMNLKKLLDINISCIGKLKKTEKKNYTINLFDKNKQKIIIKKFGYEH